MEVQGQKNIKMFCKDYVERAEVCFLTLFKSCTRVMVQGKSNVSRRQRRFPQICCMLVANDNLHGSLKVKPIHNFMICIFL
jgi:hypothetical protein